MPHWLGLTTNVYVIDVQRLTIGINKRKLGSHWHCVHSFADNKLNEFPYNVRADIIFFWLRCVLLWRGILHNPSRRKKKVLICPGGSAVSILRHLLSTVFTHLNLASMGYAVCDSLPQCVNSNLSNRILQQNQDLQWQSHYVSLSTL